jgi:endonuclease-3
VQGKALDLLWKPQVLLPTFERFVNARPWPEIAMPRKKKLPDPQSATVHVMRERVAEVVRRFEEVKGTLHFPGLRDPMAGLVRTLLSHNTTDPNAFAAYDRMVERYPSWRQVHHAPVKQLAETIRIAGLNNQKAERIQKLLSYVHEIYGDYTADVLKGMNFDQALESFGHLPGVKHKTLAVVLAFDLGRDVFPVDTHVHRLCRRLGFVPDSFDPVKTFKAMRELVPKGKSYSFHLHLIRHGREVCHARGPKCESCLARDLCLYYQTEKSRVSSGDCES